MALQWCGGFAALSHAYRRGAAYPGDGGCGFGWRIFLEHGGLVVAETPLGAGGRRGLGQLRPAAAQLAAPVIEDSVVGSGQCGRDDAPTASRSRVGAGARALASPVVPPARI